MQDLENNFHFQTRSNVQPRVTFTDETKGQKKQKDSQNSMEEKLTSDRIRNEHRQRNKKIYNFRIKTSKY